MLARMSSQELTGWQTYFAIEPFGEERADLRAATGTSAVVNTLRAAHFKNPDMTSPVDFMPFTEKPDPTTEALVEKIEKLFGA